MNGTAPITAVVQAGPVIPVVVLNDAQHAVPLAQALLDGGVRVMEITLRTRAGLASIERVAAEVPDMLVGAGTVTTPGEAGAVTRAGARFLVLPGSPAALVDAAVDTGLPVLPAAVTLTEMMTLAHRGLTTLKFFPAEASGGMTYLSAVFGPLPHLRFCPTGGVSAANAPAYLAQPNVPCVGGSWLTPPALVAAEDWAAVTAHARAASALSAAT